MAKKEAKSQPKLHVPAMRAKILDGFLRLAKDVLKRKPELNSVTLQCSQFYADEAGDAVHDNIIASAARIPTVEDGGEREERVPYETLRTFMSWDSNFEAVYAFAPFCNEEGWTERPGESEDGEDDYGEGGTPAALAVVERLADGDFRASWVGVPHRAWLDFPGALADRDDMGDEAPEFVEDPPAPPLAGKEKDLQAQVFADPTDLGVREVLRDVWSLRDDPRGEFAALSTAPAPTAKMRARAA